MSEQTQAMKWVIKQVKRGGFTPNKIWLWHDSDCTDSQCTNTCVVTNLYPDWRELPIELEAQSNNA